MAHVFCKIFLIFTVSILASSCKTIDNHGQLVSDEDIALAATKHPTQAQLIDMIGSPTYIPHHSPNTWYYIHRSVVSGSFTSKKLIEQRVVEAQFSAGRLSKIFVATEMKPRELKVASEMTDSTKLKTGGVKKFVKNIGRFNKTKPTKKKKK
jgi:outer membrane protein assembly factor BamE (lipoprotein component of BamABCDE complex)